MHYYSGGSRYVGPAEGTLTSGGGSANSSSIFPFGSFNIHLGATPGSSISGTVTLQRRPSDSTLSAFQSFTDCTYPDGSLVSFTLGVNTTWQEVERGYEYRLACSSGTAIPYRLSYDADTVE